MEKVWKQILRVIFLNGEISSKEIAKITGFGYSTIFESCKRMILWQYLKKPRQEITPNKKNLNWRINYYEINPTKEENIKKIVSEMEE